MPFISVFSVRYWLYIVIPGNDISGSFVGSDVGGVGSDVGGVGSDVGGVGSDVGGVGSDVGGVGSDVGGVGSDVGGVGFCPVTGSISHEVNNAVSNRHIITNNFFMLPVINSFRI